MSKTYAWVKATILRRSSVCVGVSSATASTSTLRSTGARIAMPFSLADLPSHGLPGVVPADSGRVRGLHLDQDGSV
jgi:hypothetical protein